jgi:hypothetical protein
VVLNMMLVTAILVSLPTHYDRPTTPQPPPPSGGGAAPKDFAPMTVIFLAPTEPARLGTRDEFKALARSTSDLTVVVGQPDFESFAPRLEFADPTDAPAGEAPTNGDQATRAVLFGRYMGQIDARIERAWTKPATLAGHESFACRVSVLQDAVGNVRAVDLEQCTGDSRWQQSLVRAIQSASPLPAPPDPAVFTPTLRLVFSADAPDPPVQLDQPQVREDDRATR